MTHTPSRIVLAGLAGLVLLATPAEAVAAVCYQLPFPNPNLADGNGSSPLALAKGRGFTAMERMIAEAGGK